MTTDEQLEALAQRHARLVKAAQAVIDAANYPANGEEEARVYKSQLRQLDRELRSQPQPHGLTFMSVS